MAAVVVMVVVMGVMVVVNVESGTFIVIRLPSLVLGREWLW